MADGDFSVVIPQDGEIISAPVYNPGPSPLNQVLSTVSQGIRQFSEDMDERARKKKQEKIDAEKEREKQARGDLFDKALAVNRAAGGGASNPWMGPVEAIAAKPPVIEGVDTGGSAVFDGSLSPSDAILEGAVASGAITSERMGELESAVSSGQEEVGNIQTAVAQGNMPRVSVDAAMDRIFQDFRHRFPDVDVEVITSMMEKMGMKTALGYNVEAAYKDMDASRQAFREERKANIEAGSEILGQAALTLTEDQIAEAGAARRKSDAEIAAVLQGVEIETKRAGLTEAQRKLDKEAAATTINQITIQDAMNTFAPLINSARDLIDIMGQNPGSNPAAEDQFREVMGLLKGRLPALIENYANQVAATTGDTAQSQTIRDHLTKTLEATILTPLENRDSDFLNMAKTLETNLGLRTSEAFPIIAMMKSVGINLPLADLVMGQLDGPMRDSIAKEMKGLTTNDIYTLRGRESAGTQLLNMVRVLEGDTTLNQLNMEPAQLNRYFKTINNATVQIGRQISTGNLDQQDAYLNGMAETAIAAEQLSRGSPVLALTNAVASLTGRSASNFRTLISKGEDPEKAQLVALGARGGVARAMQGLKMKEKTYGFHTVVYDKRTGKWGVQFNESAWKASPASRMGGGDPMDTKLGINTGMRKSAPKVPAEARAMVSALNAASDFLVGTADMDEGAPKATELELRRWYNEDKAPASVINQLEAKRKAGAGGVMKALNAFEEVLQEGDFDLTVPTRPGAGGSAVDAEGNVVVKGQKGQDVVIESATTIRSKYGNKPEFKRLDSEIDAKGLGQYKNIILSQIGLESKFRHNASSGSSYGVMQINASAWNDVARERYGKSVPNLSRDQNIDLGLWIWAENLKAAGGNVEDAVSMYHSGKDYKFVDQRNIGDGNMYTRDYVNGIMAASGA